MISISRFLASTLIVLSFISFSSCQTEVNANLHRPNFNSLNDTLDEIKPFKYKEIEHLLEKHKINGASIAYINYDKKGWTRAYGFADSKKTTPIKETTQFQAASISKVFSAYTMMYLVNNNRFSLDTDLRPALKTIGIQNQYPNTILSLRNLLKHKAGINYYNLKGYSRKDSLPSLENVIAGELPAHNEAIKVVEEPYKSSKYSEGGYVILEKIINERLKGRGNPTPFNELIKYTLFGQLNMKNTSLAEPIDTNDIAFGHSRNKQMLPGKFLNYPEKAAGGIWTTAQDIALLAYEIAGYKNNTNQLRNNLLSEDFVTDGLGVSYDSQKNLFGSFGRNEGYSCHFSFSLNKLYGIVIMTNSENGGPFIEDVYQLINERYASYLKSQNSNE